MTQKLLLFLVYLSVCSAQLIINTSYGLVEGHIVNGIRTFTSIRYATAPIKSLRWAPPQPMQPWGNNIYNATINPWGCPQNCTDGVPGICPYITNEDCLVLNIYAPQSQNMKLYPVMIYIHGGVYYEGFSGGIRLNATNLANFNKNTVIVSINYRLGALGFFWNPKLNITGNYGIEDQIFSLKWIYENIENFSGDKNRMIIFGESAGAHSVAIHLLNEKLTDPLTGIIKGGIMESTPIGLPLRSTQSWGEMPDIFSDLCGCIGLKNELECLRSIPSELIVENQFKSVDIMTVIQSEHYLNINTGYCWSPTTNTTLIPKQPVFEYQNLSKNKYIPSFIIGINRNEANLFLNDNNGIYSYFDLIEFITFMIGKEYVEEILNFYNIPFDKNGFDYINYATEIFTDFAFKCPTRNITLETIKNNYNNSNNYYVYHFEYVSSFNRKLYPQKHLCWNNVCHTNEMWYVWNDYIEIVNATFNESEINLVKQYELYWTNFGQSLNPNYPNNTVNVEWKQYDESQQETLMINIDNQMRMEMNVDKIICDFWDSFHYSWLNGVNF